MESICGTDSLWSQSYGYILCLYELSGIVAYEKENL